MAKISIKRRDDAAYEGKKAPLYAVVNIDREKIRIPTGVMAAEAEWDPDKEVLRGKGKEIDDMNLVLLNMKSRISDVFVQYRLAGKPLDKLNFLKAMRRTSLPDDFHAFADDYLKKRRNSIRYTTWLHQLAVLSKVRKYSPVLRMSDITPEWVREYALYLRDKHGNAPSTIRKNLSTIRQYCAQAIKEGLMRDDPFEGYRMPVDDPEVVFLKDSEIEAMIALYRSGRLSDARQSCLRFFLFMLFTGMHISDARNLRIEQVGMEEITYTRIKTGKRVVLSINEPIRKLVDFYRGSRKRGVLIEGLPTDQKFNRLIKEVAAEAGINKSVSAKVGRHSFATTYLNRNVGDLATLSKLLGHTSIDMTMRYVHVLNENKEKGMSVFNGML